MKGSMDLGSMFCMRPVFIDKMVLTVNFIRNVISSTLR